MPRCARLATVTGTPAAQIRHEIRRKAGDPLTPIVVQSGIHPDTIAYLAEHQLEFPGVQLADTLPAQVPVPVARRAHPRLRRPDHADRVQDAQEAGLPADRQRRPVGDRVGVRRVPPRPRRLGAAHGRLARAADEPDRAGRRCRAPGNALRLTIDVDLQRAAERALRDGIALAHADGAWAANGGAIVAMDPRDGSILALASNPTYKPSVYVGRRDPSKLAPLQNPGSPRRRTSPGSTARSTSPTRRARRSSR